MDFTPTDLIGTNRYDFRNYGITDVNVDVNDQAVEEKPQDNPVLEEKPVETTKPDQQVVADSRKRTQNDNRTGQVRSNLEQMLPVKRYKAEPSRADVQAGNAPLKAGDKGPQVRELQSRLNDNGAKPPLKIDGYYGPKTRAQVVVYQARTDGLDVSGVANPNTLEKLGLRGGDKTTSEPKAPVKSNDNPTVGTTAATQTTSKTNTVATNEAKSKANTNSSNESKAKTNTDVTNDAKAKTNANVTNEAKAKTNANVTNEAKVNATNEAKTKPQANVTNDAEVKTNTIATNEAKSKPQANVDNDKSSYSTTATKNDDVPPGLDPEKMKDEPIDGPDKTRLTRDEFLEEFEDRSVRADTRLPGAAYLDRADLDHDGIIKGRTEWNLAFDQVDLHDKNGDEDSVDLGKRQNVQTSLDALRNAPDGAKGRVRYSKTAKQNMDWAIDGGKPNMMDANTVSGRTDYLGRPLSNKTIEVTMWTGTRQANVYYDPTKNRFYKQGNEGPIVAMSDQEVRDLRKNLKEYSPMERDATREYAEMYIATMGRTLSKDDREDIRNQYRH